MLRAEVKARARRRRSWRRRRRRAPTAAALALGSASDSQRKLIRDHRRWSRASRPRTHAVRCTLMAKHQKQLMLKIIAPRARPVAKGGPSGRSSRRSGPHREDGAQGAPHQGTGDAQKKAKEFEMEVAAPGAGDHGGHQPLLVGAEGPAHQDHGEDVRQLHLRLERWKKKMDIYNSTAKLVGRILSRMINMKTNIAFRRWHEVCRVRRRCVQARRELLSPEDKFMQTLQRRPLEAPGRAAAEPSSSASATPPTPPTSWPSPTGSPTTSTSSSTSRPLGPRRPGLKRPPHLHCHGGGKGAAGDSPRRPTPDRAPQRARLCCPATPPAPRPALTAMRLLVESTCRRALPLPDNIALATRIH